MESLIFIEILRRGYRSNLEVFSYKTKSAKEIDFLLRKETKIEKLLQVSYEVGSLQTRERELKAIIEAGKELGCNDLEIITWDENREETVRGKKVHFIPLWKWLGI
jgi:predicted AAA+ superfamily ATPase